MQVPDCIRPAILQKLLVFVSTGKGFNMKKFYVVFTDRSNREKPATVIMVMADSIQAVIDSFSICSGVEVIAA
jgi:hypothetical protein